MLYYGLTQWQKNEFFMLCHYANHIYRQEESVTTVTTPAPLSCASPWPHPDDVSVQRTQALPVVCVPFNPEGFKLERQFKSSLLPPPVSLSVCVDRDRDFGVIWSSCSVGTSSRPSNTGNPLTSASRLCCGRMSVCTFLRHRSCVHVPASDGFCFSGGGLWHRRSNEPRSRGTHTRKVK